MIVLVRGYEEKFEYNTEFYELRAVLSTKDYDNVLLQYNTIYEFMCLYTDDVFVRAEKWFEICWNFKET